MTTEFQVVPNKTYATRANAVVAATRHFPPSLFPGLRFFIMPVADLKRGTVRFFPVFTGQSAIEAQVFRYFNVVA